MILYGIEALRDSGIKHILISLSYVNPYGFMELLGDGSEYGVHISYLHQHEVRGIAWAINEAHHWIGDEPFIVYLGDNIFVDGIEPFIKRFTSSGASKPLVLLKEVETMDEARRYGVAKFQGSEVTQLFEKPSEPPSQHILLGLYCLTPRFFEMFPQLKPSGRGEYEITDALNLLMPVNYEVYEDEWWDCGVFRDITEASQFMMVRGEQK